MKPKALHITLTVFIALVWLINGLFCKVLDFVPRHEEIVSEVLSKEFSKELIMTFGILEIMMAFWVLSKIKIKLCSVLQIVLVMTMNVIELIKVPELLLFEKLNFVFALLFSGLIYYNGLVLSKK